MKFNFCGPTYQSVSPNIDAEEAINLYCERSESAGAKSPMGMLGTPGKKLYAALNEVAIPGAFPVNGRGFIAASSLWEVGLPGGPVNRGSLGGTPIGPTQMIANETQLLVLNNGNLYVLTLATNVFTAVNMAQFNGPVAQIDFSDGYGIATIQNSHTFQQSNLEDFTTWTGLNIATVSLFPDNITSMICDHRELWLFSQKKTAVYYNSGAGFPVFIPIQGAFLETGADSAFATVRADNTICWISRDERGSLMANRANGYTPQRISTHAVETAWQKYATTSDAVGFSYQENGHTFWVIRFPSANATWAYDFSTQLWHKRGFWDAAHGVYTADRATCHMEFNGMHLVGDWATGNVYQQSMSFYDDFGNPIRRLRRSPTLSKENEWLYFTELLIDQQPGIGPIPPLKDPAGRARGPHIALRWSDTFGQTWGNTRYLDCGQAGQFKKRIRKTMLGRSRNRVWEISMTDPVQWAIADAYVQVQPEAA